MKKQKYKDEIFTNNYSSIFDNKRLESVKKENYGTKTDNYNFRS